MKAKLKKALAMLLVLCFAVSLAPMALAAGEETSGTCGDNLTWSLDTNTGALTISGEGEMDDYNVGDAPWYALRESIVTVAIQYGATSIGQYAFADCTYLTRISIQDSIAEIGCYAFKNCSNLTYIEILSRVEVIDVGTFYN